MVFSPSNYDRFILFFLLLFAIKQMKQEKKKNMFGPNLKIINKN